MTGTRSERHEGRDESSDISTGERGRTANLGHPSPATLYDVARLAGVSQPHIHNVLKGKRFFSLEKADQVLRSLGLDVLDLVEPEEWNQRHLHR